MGLGEASRWDKQRLEVSCQPEVRGISQGARSLVSRLQEKPGLPLRRKVCYAVGGIPYQMTGNVLGFFLQIFLLDVVQLKPFHASLIIFLGRAWDAVTDPAIGFLVSKSPRRKYGKLVPWIAYSMPFGVLCYCMMWSTLSDATPASLKFLWYLFTYSFFQTCMTCYHVPYSSLTMFLGGTQQDRDSATAYRMGMEVFSTLLGSGIQGQIVGSYHTRMMNGCYVPNETLPNTSTYSLTDSLGNTRRAYVFASLVLGSIYCLSCLILIFGVREQPGARPAVAGGELGGRDVQASYPDSELGISSREPVRIAFPDHTGDLCLLLYSCRGAGREIPAFSAYHVGHSFPLYSLLAMVFGKIWKENSSVTGPAADDPSPGSHHPGDAQLPGLRLPDDHGRLQHGRALPSTLVHAAGCGG
ncbi:sodium-dependent lysophosphatidylcholine symporter 1-like isoform 5-T5 [Leptosomus discolor]